MLPTRTEKPKNAASNPKPSPWPSAPAAPQTAHNTKQIRRPQPNLVDDLVFDALTAFLAFSLLLGDKMQKLIRQNARKQTKIPALPVWIDPDMNDDRMSIAPSTEISCHIITIPTANIMNPSTTTTTRIMSAGFHIRTLTPALSCSCGANGRREVAENGPDTTHL